VPEHPLGGCGCGISGPVQHIPAERIDTAHIHTGIPGLLGDPHTRVTSTSLFRISLPCATNSRARAGQPPCGTT
jgi:hypothetical protein